MRQPRIRMSMLLIIITGMIASCGPSIRTTVSWVNQQKKVPQPNKTIFIAVFTSNVELKTMLENDLYDAARAKGLTAYTSSSTLGPFTSVDNLPNKDAFLLKVRALECQTILTVALVDEKSETRYVQGSSVSFAPYPLYGYYGGFGSYYGYATNFYTPGYYTTDKTYFIECNLYDAKTEDILMSIQSKASNPPGIVKSSKLYTASLVKEIDVLKERYK